MYKLLLCDFDDTLTSDGNMTVPEHVQSEIRRFAAKNHFALVSGRAYFGPMQRILREWGLPGLHVLGGGSVIYDSQKEQVIWEVFLSADIAQKFIAYARAHEYDFIIDEGVVVYTSMMNRLESEFLTEYTYAAYDQLPGKQVSRCMMFLRDKNHAFEVERELGHLFPTARIVPWYAPSLNASGVDVAPATKLEGVNRLYELLGVHRDEVIAVGDGLNDFPLFMAAGKKIAVANAQAELKEIADEVTTKPYGDGVLEVIAKYF